MVALHVAQYRLYVKKALHFLQEIAKQEGFRATFMPAPFEHKYMGMYYVHCVCRNKSSWAI